MCIQVTKQSELGQAEPGGGDVCWGRDQRGGREGMQWLEIFLRYYSSSEAGYSTHLLLYFVWNVEREILYLSVFHNKVGKHFFVK